MQLTICEGHCQFNDNKGVHHVTEIDNANNFLPIVAHNNVVVVAVVLNDAVAQLVSGSNHGGVELFKELCVCVCVCL